MKALGHKAFGLILLTPILMGKTINYIDIGDKYIRSINNTIYNLNSSLIEIQKVLLYQGFDLYYLKEFIFLMFMFFMGIKFPDVDLLLKKYGGSSFSNLRYLYHRQFTHSIFIFIFLFLYFGKNQYLTMFFYGVITHLIADMLTGSVPLFFHGYYYKSLNIFTLRIGIDLFYILTKPSYMKGSTLIQKTIDKIKLKIVDFFEVIGKWVIFLYFMILAIYKFFY